MAEQNNSFPVISEKNWWTIREKFKATIPQVVSPKYIKTLLNMANDSSASSNVLVPMRRIGLVDEDNKPTPLANDWRINDKYRQVCEKILKTVYPDELLDLFPNSDVDRNTARTWFMSSGVGQSMAGKMAAFFALLKSGEIKEKKTDRVSNHNSSKTQVAKQSKENRDAVNAVASPSQTMEKVEGHKSQNRPNLHIDLQIHISPDSTPEQIETIFASMAKHLYGMDGK